MDTSSWIMGSTPSTTRPVIVDHAGAMDTGCQENAHRLVTFRLEGQRYALPLTAVERILRMVEVSPLPKAPAIVLGVVNYHGQIIPVIDLQRRFGRPIRNYGLSSILVVARTKRRTLALPVDDVLGVQEVATEIVSPPTTVCPGIGLVVGIAALPDGVLFIQDLDAFLSLEEDTQLGQALEATPP